ncbi:terminase family protein [Photobacterium sp. 1_MG-2023]|uniref:terminase family protein n=1 Tax=Photobacterium sp. 1_MG-2023 TaxID=3062646 RepID=UPI0026E149B9|nr:terminase family protein [Photobacterium sp. 1_MG-2023]MDO6706780.1 terminase family protein [Photobacterium sp. 1_MG-2023]
MSDVDLTLQPQQSIAFESLATEILYGGAAGGGKSHLMRVIAVYLCTEVPGIQVYLFRRLSDDLYKNHMEGAGGFLAMLGPWFDSGFAKFNEQKNVLKFWNGSKVWLSHCQYEKDRFKYQGPEIHVLLVDELTHFTEKIYRFLRNRVRLGGLAIPEHLKGKLPLIICGTNPGGVGHNWVKRTFVDFAAPLEVTKTPKKEGGMLRQFIPAKLSDNQILLANDPDYEDRLEGLGDAAMVKAMLDGDWNIVAGGALDDVWNQSRQVLPRFKVPSSWRVDRSFDWGSSHPFSVGWWAEADGTEATMADGSIFCPPKGSIIRIHEWYGTREAGTNEGLKLSAKEIARGIKEREAELMAAGWISRKPAAGPADNQISAVVRSDIDTIEQEMKKEGVSWLKSDKSPGSRINGLQLVRDRLKEAMKERPEDPGLFFMEHCRAAISTLPILPRDEKKPDDVNTESEDHVYDEVRYRVLASKRMAMSINMGAAF